MTHNPYTAQPLDYYLLTCKHVFMSDENQNPAVTRLTALPPALLEEIVEKPEALGALARVWAAINLEKENNNFDQMSPAQKNSHLDRCIKLGWGNNGASASVAGSGPQFTLEINMGADKVTLKATPNQNTERIEKPVFDAETIEPEDPADSPTSLSVEELDRLIDSDFSVEIE